MDEEEICRSFRLAKNKREMITILADLTDTDTETVAEVLGDAGLFVSESRCRKCGRKYKRLLDSVCRDCAEKIAREKAHRAAREKWVRFLIAENEVRRASLLRQAALIEAENKKLKEALCTK